jgi:hypothetical protein
VRAGEKRNAERNAPPPQYISKELVFPFSPLTNLVHEDDRRRVLPRHHEQLPDHAGPLADVLLDQLRAGDADEGAVGVVRDRAGQQRLARSGRAVEEDPLRLRDAEGVEELRVLDGELDDLLDLLSWKREREGERERERKRGRGGEEEKGIGVEERVFFPLLFLVLLPLLRSPTPNKNKKTRWSTLICLSSPPTMSYVESGTFSTFIRLTSGSTFVGSNKCKAYESLRSATRIPAVISALSTPLSMSTTYFPSGWTFTRTLFLPMT